MLTGQNLHFIKIENFFIILLDLKNLQPLCATWTTAQIKWADCLLLLLDILNSFINVTSVDRVSLDKKIKKSKDGHF